ncbi:hypothetical protein AMTRI_Chr10g7630 [Amborella trichopoda]
MEDSHEILLNGLEQAGIKIPIGVSSIQDLTTGALVSICSQSLRLIDDSFVYPTSLPVSMAERFRLSTTLSAAIKGLGYRGDLSFHQFLYPSDEDSYKLVRFLVEKLSKFSSNKVGGRKGVGTRVRVGGNDRISTEFSSCLKNWIEKEDTLSEDHAVLSQVKTKSRNWSSVLKKNELLELKAGSSEPSNTVVEKVFVGGSFEDHLISVLRESATSNEALEPESSVSDVKLSESSQKETNVEHIKKLELKLASLVEQSSQMKFTGGELQNQVEKLKAQESTNVLEIQQLEEKRGLLKAAADMALDDQHPNEFYLEELNKRVEARKQNLEELQLQWDSFKHPLEERIKRLKNSLSAKESKAIEKLQCLNKIELETEAVISETIKREAERLALSEKLEKRPKTASRASYIQRITELTKNSRKQDIDIERIVEETRQLHIENNSIQDRLNRTYTVVDETVFRDAMNDPLRQQAYRLLTGIHDSFAKISETILANDKVKRETTELEAKLESLKARNFNLEKIQADINSIRQENEYLEQRIRH